MSLKWLILISETQIIKVITQLQRYLNMNPSFFQSHTCESNDCFQLVRSRNENNSPSLRAQRLVSASAGFCRFWLLSTDQPQQPATIFRENALKNTVRVSKRPVGEKRRALSS